MIGRPAAALLLAIALAGCGGKKDGSHAPDAASSVSQHPQDASALTPAGSAPPAAEGARLDLSSRGLPLTIVVPSCVEVKQPIIKIADNARDLTMMCDPDAIGGKVFAIQLGPSSGKLARKDIEDSPDFVRFTSEEPGFLEWESKLFNQPVTDFMVRTTKGGVEYACFPMFPAPSKALLADQLAACRSLEAK